MRSQFHKTEYDKLQSGIRIRQARENASMKSIDLAAELGISETQMSRIENGSSGCTVGTLIQIADVLGVSVDFLLSRNIDNAPSPKPSELYGLRKEIDQKLNSITVSQMSKVNQMIDIICS